MKKIDELVSKGYLLETVPVANGKTINDLIFAEIGGTDKYTITDSLSNDTATLDKEIIKIKSDSGEFQKIFTSDLTFENKDGKITAEITGPGTYGAVITAKVNDSGEVKEFNNALTLQPHSPDKPLTDTVHHTPITISKSVEPKNIPNGYKGDITYKISPSKNNFIGINKLSFEDNISELVENGLTLTGINFGEFNVDYKGDTGDFKWAVRITEKDDTTVDDPTVEIIEADKITETFVEGYDYSKITKIEWLFYDPESAENDYTITSFDCKTSPTLTFRLNDGFKIDGDKVSKELTNTVTVNDNTETPLTTAEAPLNVSDFDVEKVMKVKSDYGSADSDYRNADEGEKIEMEKGDKVQFVVTIKNKDTANAIDLKNFEITDTLSGAFDAKKVKSSDLKVEIFDAGDESGSKITSFKVSPEGEENQFTISFSSGSIPAGGRAEITMEIPVENLVKLEDDVTKVQLLNNRITVNGEKTETVTAEIIPSYKLDVRLQKGIRTIDDKDGNEADLNIYSINKEKDEDGKMSPTSIVYDAVVYNSLESTVDLPVRYLVDRLPEDFLFSKMVKSTEKSELNGVDFTSPAKKYEEDFEVDGNETEKGRIEFTLTGTAEDGSKKDVVLEPGQYLVFSYECEIDIDARHKVYEDNIDSNGDVLKSKNTLYLAVEDEYAVGSLKVTTTDVNFEHDYTNQNDGSCDLIEDNEDNEDNKDWVYTNNTYTRKTEKNEVYWLESDVTITPDGFIKPKISKDLVAYKSGASNPKQFEKDGGSYILTGDTKSSIKWKIVIENKGTASISGYNIKDTMPDGYRFMEESDKYYGVDELDTNQNKVVYEVEKINETGEHVKKTRIAKYSDIVLVIYSGDKIENFYLLKVDEDGDLTQENGAKLPDIAANQRTGILYWGVYEGLDLGMGEKRNRVDIQFNQPLDNSAKSTSSYNSGSNSVRGYALFNSVGAYSSSSVKQIIDLDDPGKADGTGVDSQDRDIFGKKITDWDPVDRTASYNNSNDGYNDNEGNTDFDFMCVIDRLPHIGDYGTNNLSELYGKRGSQFRVKINEDKPFEVDITEGINNEPDESTGLVQNKDFVILYSNRKFNQGYTTAEWTCTDVVNSERSFADLIEEVRSATEDVTFGNGWHSKYNAETDYSFRIIFKDDSFVLKSGKTLRIYFEGVIGDDAKPGEIA